MHFSLQIWEGNGGASYSPNVAYLAHCWEWGGRRWRGVIRGRSWVTAAGSPRQQEWDNAVGPGLGGGGVPGVQSKGGRSGVPAATYYGAREEGTGGAGTLGKESLRHLYVPPSHDWCAPPPININIGKCYCRVTYQCGPAAVAKLQLPSCLDRLG